MLLGIFLFNPLRRLIYTPSLDEETERLSLRNPPRAVRVVRQTDSKPSVNLTQSYALRFLVPVAFAAYSAEVQSLALLESREIHRTSAWKPHST